MNRERLEALNHVRRLAASSNGTHLITGWKATCELDSEKPATSVSMQYAGFQLSSV